METLNEDTGAAWAKRMLKGYEGNIRDDESVAAWIAVENRKRLKVADTVLAKGPEGFVKDALEYFEKNAPAVYRRNRQSIERMAREYADARQQQAVQRQVAEDIERIFSY